MGSGKAKAHEAFTIAPAPEAFLDPLEKLTAGSPAADLVAPVPQVGESSSPAAAATLNELVDPAELDTDQVLAGAWSSSLTCQVCGKTTPVAAASGWHDTLCPDCWPLTTKAKATAAAAASASASAAADDVEHPSSEDGESVGPTDDDPTPSTPNAASDGAAHEQNWSSDNLLTPIPDQLTVGDGIGTAVAVGGADLLEGAAILTSYQDPDAGPPHEVLRVTLTPDAEDKLLDALRPPDAPKVPIQVPETISGRLPIDLEHHLHEDLAIAAKSINHHRKNGTDIPPHTLERVAGVQAKLDALQAAEKPAEDSPEQQMLAHYQAALDQCKQRIADATTPYGPGAKVPMINAFDHTGQVMVTKLVPDPTFQGTGLAVTKRAMSRIGAHSIDGTSTWDGTSRDTTSGTELAIDLGDGFHAVVRPTTMNPPGHCAASLRGTLEITAPPGAGNQQQLLDHLNTLNIVNRPMNAAEAEWTYLQRNLLAHNIADNPAVTSALQSGTDIEEAHAHRLLMHRAPQAIGLDDASLAQFARTLQLDAEADALPDKVRLLKDGVAKALGHPDTATMTGTVSYHPIPHRARGWLTWGRIGQSAGDLQPAFAGKCITHHITGAHHNLTNVLVSGVLASTERRRMMGVQHNIGMSESSDMKSGGASNVFLRVQSQSTHLSGPHLIWNNPEKILSRTDWYAYNGDHFGAAIAGTGYSTSGQTRDPHHVATYSGGANEVMVSHGLDLLGADAPDKVICPPSLRNTLLAELAQAGISTIGGRPIEKVVIAG